MRWRSIIVATVVAGLPPVAPAQVVQPAHVKDTLVTGRVTELKLTLQNEPPGPGRQFYFEVTILAEGKVSVTFKLPRSFSEAVDQLRSGEEYFAVPYSAIAVALISTLREALLQGNDVTIRGELRAAMETGPSLAGRPAVQIPLVYLLLREATMHK